MDSHRQRNDRYTSTSYRRYDNLHKIQSLTTTSPRPAWSSAPNLNGSTGEGSNGSDDAIKNSLSSSVNSTTPLSAFTPSDIHQGIRFADEEVEDFRLPLYLEPEEPDGDSNKPRDIRLTADPATGLYGFNLRYGKDFSSAYFSRIVANSPADCCYPRIHVGDQLVAVNGHPLQCLTQAEASNFLARYSIFFFQICCSTYKFKQIYSVSSFQLFILLNSPVIFFYVQPFKTSFNSRCQF